MVLLNFKMTVGRSKSRSFLTLIFIVKSVSTNLLIRIFIIKAKLSARVLHHQEEKIYIYIYIIFVIHRVKIDLGSSSFSFCQEMVRNGKENSFYKRNM